MLRVGMVVKYSLVVKSRVIAIVSLEYSVVWSMITTPWVICIFDACESMPRKVALRGIMKTSCALLSRALLSNSRLL